MNNKEKYFLKNKNTAMVVKIGLILIYSFGVTVLTNCVNTILNHFGKAVASTFFLIPLGLFFLYKFYKNQNQKLALVLPVFISFRIMLYLLLLLSTFFYPIFDNLSLTNNFSNYVTIDDEEYQDDPYEDQGEYYSTFKYYLKKPVTLEGLKTPQGVIVNDKAFGLSIEKENEEFIVLNVDEFFSKEYAYLMGYKPINQNEETINQILLPLNYLADVFLKDGLYTLIFSAILIGLMLYLPKSVFAENKLNNSN